MQMGICSLFLLPGLPASQACDQKGAACNGAMTSWAALLGLIDFRVSNLFKSSPFEDTQVKGMKSVHGLSLVLFFVVCHGLMGFNEYPAASWSATIPSWVACTIVQHSISRRKKHLWPEISWEQVSRKKMHMPQYIISDSLRFSNITFSGGYIAVNHAESAKELQCHPDGMMWGLPTPSWSSFSSNASDHWNHLEGYWKIPTRSILFTIHYKTSISQRSLFLISFYILLIPPNIKPGLPGRTHGRCQVLKPQFMPRDRVVPKISTQAEGLIGWFETWIPGEFVNVRHGWLEVWTIVVNDCNGWWVEDTWIAVISLFK